MNKKELFTKIFSLRNLFLWGNLLLLFVFLATLGSDQVRGWKSYQKEFKQKEIARLEEKLKTASDADKDQTMMELKGAKKMPVEIRQIWLRDSDTVDRCITCHLGHDPLSNSSLTTEYKESPYRAGASPEVDIHKLHNIEKFGCTVCHGGQGLATEVEAAHGHVDHWEKPLLQGALLQASCAKCHDNLVDLKVGASEQSYASEILRAKDLFREHGCIGCHQIGGEGGPISVDLKEETSAKPLSRIDFNFASLPHDEWTLSNWIKIHFTKDPSEFVPGDPHGEFNTEPIAPSAMPPYLLKEKDADALTAYIMGLNRKGILPQYLKPAPPEPKRTNFASTWERGRWVYEEYGCAACHGPDAKGGIRNYNYQYGVTPNLRRAVATYTREEVKAKISEGVAFVAKHDPDGPNPPLYMPAWKNKIKGEDLESLVTYLQSIRE